MAIQKKILVIAETSYIIRKGLLHVLSQLPTVSKVIEIRNPEDLNYELDKLKFDALIINPMLLGHSSRHDLKQQLKIDKNASIIALVYNMIDERFYRSYDAVIQINDSGTKIESILTETFNKKVEMDTEQEEISEREKDILIGIVKGLSNKEIADLYNISIHTVVTHRRNITRKLQIHSISGLTVYAIINKYIDINDINIT